MKSALDDLLDGLEADGHAVKGPGPKPAVAVPEPSPALEPETAWPPESLEAERKFGLEAARLYPFIGHEVWTPAGPGKLLSVIGGRCEIWPDGGGADHSR